MDCSPPGSSIQGILQARVLGWGAIAFSGAPQLLKAKCPRAHSPQLERPPLWETCAPQLESSPHLPQLEETCVYQWRPNAAKKEKIGWMTTCAIVFFGPSVVLLHLIRACFISIGSGHISCSVMSNSAIPWTIAHQAPLSMEFSRQEYWSEERFSSPGDLADPGFKPGSPELLADSLLSEPLEHGYRATKI